MSFVYTHAHTHTRTHVCAHAHAHIRTYTSALALAKQQYVGNYVASSPVWCATPVLYWMAGLT